MKNLPKFLKQYFWDVDFDSLNLTKSKTFILKRVLEVGDMKAVKWIISHLLKDDIRNLILTADDLAPKTANFWAHYLGIDTNKVPSLSRPCLRRKNIFLTSNYLNRILWPRFLPS